MNACAEAADFVHWEADLLDRGDFDAWLDLFADDGYYWVPSHPDQTSPLSDPSHVFDVRAPFHLAEALPHHDADDSLRIFAGAASWCLLPHEDGFRIRWKRVDLINSEMGMYGVSIIL